MRRPRTKTEIENDDRPIGRVLSRREVLALLGSAAGAAMLAACVPNQASTSQPESAAPALTATAVAGLPVSPTPAPGTAAPTVGAPAVGASTATVQASSAGAASSTALPACVVRPEMTVGPYFVDQQLNRSDVRVEPSDGSVKPGAPLALTFNVLQLVGNACKPLAGAHIDIWHCDAEGVYSGVSDRSFNTVGKQFLRGWQQTDANGVARFTTIFPGWYRGRTVHIHFKIRMTGAANQTYDFTSQLFFDDALSDEVFSRAPYAGKGQRDVRNADDMIFRGGGDQLLLAVTGDANGYAAAFSIALDV